MLFRSNSTREAIELAAHAKKAGADMSLTVVPYYNKPSQEGLFRHYKKIAEATKLPLILYSIPGRCGVEIAVETCVRLARDCRNIVAIKEAGGSVERVSALRAALPPAFEILSGDDSLTLPFISAGAVGVISVATNLAPEPVIALVRAALAGNFQEARRLHLQFYALFKNLFLETNPVPIKFALAAVGEMRPTVRLPLCEMNGANAETLRATLRELKLIRQ